MTATTSPLLRAIRRLYPIATASSTRPPRVLFIAERLTDAFVRPIKRLSFLEVDCLKFCYLVVNGTAALYFELVESQSLEVRSRTN